MRARVFGALIALAIGVAASHAGAAVVLNFDGFPGAANTAQGAFIPTASLLPSNYFDSTYSLQIFSFTNSIVDPHVGVGVASLGSATASPPNAIVPINTLQEFNYSSYLGFAFGFTTDPADAKATDFFSLQNPINSGKSITLYAFDRNSNPLGSVTHIASGNTTWSLSIPGMSFLRFGEFNTTNQVIAADNVTFDPVPEPGAVSLLGCVGVIAIKRFRLHAAPARETE